VVGIGERQAADAARGEVQRRRATEATGADHERARGAQAFLSLDADFRQQDVPAVAKELLVVQY